MLYRQTPLPQLILILGAALINAPVDADDDPGNGNAQRTTCARTAQTMQKACLFDVGATLHATLAACMNLAEAEREACAGEARAARGEETELCGEQLESRQEVCELLNEFRYRDPLSSSRITFVDPGEIGDAGFAPNPYVSLVPGQTQVVRAGEDGEELGVITVTNQTRTIDGVECRVVVDVAVEAATEDGAVEYEPVELTDDWYAQDSVGNVYYCGELARNYEDGVLRDLGGSFESGRELAKGGVLVKAMPAVGDAHRQEYALGEAEDVVEYVDLNATPTDAEGGENPRFHCAGNCLKTLERNPLEPGAMEIKYYVPNVGFVLAVPMEDGEFTGEREEVVCAGDSLDVLDASECGIEEPAALREQLCKLAPEAFCAEAESE